MRNEKWTEAKTIKGVFPEATLADKAGPVIYSENGKSYIDNSENHIAIVGKTGAGKSQCGSLPHIRTCIDKRESFIMVDPKGECFLKTSGFIPDDYNLYCIDFRNPRKSPTGWNPLAGVLSMLRSSDPACHDVASSMLSELWSAVFPYGETQDRFWVDAARNFTKGLTYSLFETVSDDRLINLNTVMLMLEQAESRIGIKTAVSTLYDLLPQGSLAKRNLSSYVSAPNETRSCIHSVAAAGAEVFSRSKGLMKMLSYDTLNIAELDVDRPFAIYAIIPDEESTNASLAALLISQISRHLIRVASERGGRLPIRTNIILEELCSIGKSIPNLMNLMTAGRSRGLRIMLVLQSVSQLSELYGKSSAETICSCIGVTIGFSTNDWETLCDWSRRCGERTVYKNGNYERQPLITPASLAAMPAGTALVMVNSRYKLIAQLPFFGNGKCCDTNRISDKNKTRDDEVDLDSFSFESLINEYKERKEKEAESCHVRNIGSRLAGCDTPENDFDTIHGMDLHSLFAKIDDTVDDDDEFIFSTNDEEEDSTDDDSFFYSTDDDEEEEDEDRDYSVFVICPVSKVERLKLARIICETTGESFSEATKRFDGCYVTTIHFNDDTEAHKFVDRINAEGGCAVII